MDVITYACHLQLIAVCKDVSRDGVCACDDGGGVDDDDDDDDDDDNDHTTV